ncbi:hypothetical protein [Mucilaginibacter glaciei]|uniref:Uncharacterized protein n=1 Tax=Mucilaginibacter glaciei TaxID=2772109 RepID=A0A926NS00_9SPHI|nr:hypothetical protein [Mucilaginibacter glaciei]MBD1394278.1 hypothetical protein [Mucilaginibacter glaciei]
MITNYTLTSPKITGSIELQYTAGILTCISIAIKQPLNDVQFNTLLSSVPQSEKDVENLKLLRLTVEPAMPANKKLALFCNKYLEHKGIKYMVSAADSGKIKLIKIDAPILDSYFTSKNFLFANKHTVSNLVRNYNELLAEIAAGPKSTHPDYWSVKHFEKLDSKQQSDYIKHLHSKGLKAVYDRAGNVKDYIKK